MKIKIIMLICVVFFSGCAVYAPPYGGYGYAPVMPVYGYGYGGWGHGGFRR
jgi:hypothetical protein